jgi:hypothetical protein
MATLFVASMQKSSQLLKREAIRALRQPWFDVGDKLKSALPSGKQPGVYLVRHKPTRKVIYVGMSSHLKSRVWNGHLSGSSKGRQMSQFRQLVRRRYAKAGDGEQMRRWLVKNCQFNVHQTSDVDTANGVEMLLIHALRPQPLMNKGLPAKQVA